MRWGRGVRSASHSGRCLPEIFGFAWLSGALQITSFVTVYYYASASPLPRRFVFLLHFVSCWNRWCRRTLSPTAGWDLTTAPRPPRRSRPRSSRFVLLPFNISHLSPPQQGSLTSRADVKARHDLFDSFRRTSDKT